MRLSICGLSYIFFCCSHSVYRFLICTNVHRCSWLECEVAETSFIVILWLNLLTVRVRNIQTDWFTIPSRAQVIIFSTMEQSIIYLPFKWIERCHRTIDSLIEEQKGPNCTSYLTSWTQFISIFVYCLLSFFPPNDRNRWVSWIVFSVHNR